MIILKKEDKAELDKLNDENAHLYRGLIPVEIENDKYALSADVLEDKVTWGAWAEFLEDLHVREVSEDELI